MSRSHDLLLDSGNTSNNKLLNKKSLSRHLRAGTRFGNE